MSKALQAAREVAEEYRSKADSIREDRLQSQILEQISNAFFDFAAWLEAIE